MDNTQLFRLHPFISKLLARMQTLSLNRDDPSLVLADSLLLHALIQPHTATLPPQLVVIGPTQSGKSTVVNLLLGQESAVSSPLAGYTRHAQGFASQALDDAALANIDSLLPWLHRSMDGQLAKDDLDEFSLQQTSSNVPALAALVVWDTPDFDSVSSRSYRDTVPQLCAIADAIVMVVSREKYADQSVWQLLQLLVPTGKPLTLLLNKVQGANMAALIGAVREKLDHHGFTDIRLESLLQLELDNPANLYDAPEAIDVADSMRRWATHQSRTTDTRQLSRFLQQHWPKWARPIREELDAHQQWLQIIEQTWAELEQRYIEEYLDKTEHADALQRAMARLLDLLEIPAVAGTLGRLRGVVTWPARQLGKILKKQHPKEIPASDLERQTLQRLLQHGLLRLRQQAGEQHETSAGQRAIWWQALEDSLERDAEEFQRAVANKIAVHQQAFEPEIESAAQALYRHLQDHPVTLNGLRAARVSADAAAIVLAIKSAGLGVSDLVFAPAMLAFSSMLTEGALGQYMKTIEQQLRNTQLESTHARVLQPLQHSLLALTDKMDSSRLLGISESELAEAQKALEQLA